MRLGNIHQEIAKLSQELVEARSEDDIDRIETLEDQISELEEEAEAYELDSIDERSFANKGNW